MKRALFLSLGLIPVLWDVASRAHAQVTRLIEIESINPSQLQTRSDVFVADDGYMYFQETDQACRA